MTLPITKCFKNLSLCWIQLFLWWTIDNDFGFTICLITDINLGKKMKWLLIRKSNLVVLKWYLNQTTLLLNNTNIFQKRSTINKKNMTKSQNGTCKLWKLRVIEICCCGMNLIFDSWLTRPHQREAGQGWWGSIDQSEARTGRLWPIRGPGPSKPCIGFSHSSAVTWHRPLFKYPHPQFRFGLQAHWSQ